ncbi:zinc finger C-x8-C-x5-C-x3-H type family protein [Tasmannia lanceolata]|uniref:zinc finger C-x8-C-x5-C-x3-H type family protein n=1 Tax=Tasmannia lanceolata TaxID=3420 RepID=UPI004064B3FD
MNRRKEPCRNFMRGSCQYGERCKFLHVSQQQPKPNSFGFGAQSGSQSFHTSQQQQKPNPFGFGAQSGSQSFHTSQQQQKTNPFGFGVQNSSPSKGGSDFGAKYQNQVKPFENKWTRFSLIAPGSSVPSRQTDSQPQVADHKCTDPESCKRVIVEDFEHERPLWKLTSYGHWKNCPCDISGDISYEELRAAAYDDAKRGLSLQSIVERERNLLNSKLIEFENLVRNPYVIHPNPSSSGLSPFPGTNPSASPIAVQNNAPPLVSSFSQLGTSINSGFGVRPLAPSNSALGPSSPFQNSIPTSGLFGMNSSTFSTPGSFSGQPPAQPFGSAPNSNLLNLNNGVMNAGSNPFSFTPVASSHLTTPANNQLSSFFNGPTVAANEVGQTSIDGQLAENKKTEVPEDLSIWLKQEWKRGEIPDEPPPDSLL